MNKKIRSDSDSESARRGIHTSATAPMALNKRASTVGNVHRGSIYYPANSDTSQNPNNRLSNTSVLPLVYQQRFPTRSSDEISIKRVNNVAIIKPPREVSLRVKFIRLGEVNKLAFFSFI